MSICFLAEFKRKIELNLLEFLYFYCIKPKVN